MAEPRALLDEYSGDKEKLESEFADRVEEWEKLRSELHHAMEKSHDFYHGRQMPKPDEDALKAGDRPIVVINKIAPSVDALYGAVIHNSLGMSFVSPHATDPAGPLVPRVDEVMDGTASYVRACYNADGKDRAAIIDMMIGGIGVQWMRTDNTGKYQDVVVDHVDPFTVGWDTGARDSGLIDRRWDFVKKWLSDREFKEEFGQSPEDMDLAPGASANVGTMKDKTDHADRPHEILIWQWYEMEPYRTYDIWIKDPERGDTLVSVSKDVTLSEEADFLAGNPLIHRKSEKTRQRRVYWEAKTYGTRIIETYRLSVGCFTRTFLTGKRDRSTGVWYGIVRHAESPQEWANTFFASIIYTIASGGKGWLAERGVFADPDTAIAEWSRPDKIKIVEDGALSQNRMLQIEGQQLPPGLADMAQMAIAFVPEALGTSLELRGLQANNQSGVTEGARADASIGVVGWIFSEIREFYQRHGRLLLDFIIRYIEVGRMIKMTTSEGDRYAQFQPPGEDVHYDVVVDDVPSSPNRRRAVFQALQQLAPVMALKPDDIPPGTLLEFFKASPMPGDAVRRLEENAAKPNPAAEKMQEVQFQTAVGQLRLIGAETEKVAAEARATMAKIPELVTQAVLNAAKARESGQDAETAQRIAETELQQKAIEGHMDLAIKQQKADLDHAAAVQKARLKGAEQINQLAFNAEQRRMSENAGPRSND